MRILLASCLFAILAKSAFGVTVGILGDSISTGAVAHKAIGFDGPRLDNIVAGKLLLQPGLDDIKLLKESGFTHASDFASPKRVWFSIREYEGGLSWIGKHLMMTLSSLFLDVEEYSWGNLVARNMGAKPSKILIAAEDGARMLAAKRQLDRILDHTGGLAPDHLFVLFTGNDLCGPTMNFVTSKEAYSEQLADLIAYYERSASFEGSQGHVWLMDPIGALQLTHSKEIQKKVVMAHGKKMTCRELHHLDPMSVKRAEGVLGFIPQTPAAYCPMLLLNKTEDDKKRLGTLGSKILGYREAIAEKVASYQKEASEKKASASPLTLHHVDSTGKIILTADDIAEDCFHLSLKGQIKMAKSVISTVSKL